jgi:tetratricopeptide (TPR) repeat protein
MTRTVNLKFLAGLLGAAVAFGTSVHFLHGYQLKRNAGALLERANRAEREGRPDQASEYMSHYLAYAPGDSDALARYGFLLDKSAKSRRALERVFLLFDRTLEREPGRADVRRRQAQIAITLGRYSDAEDHLRQLRTDPPTDAEVEELLGQCQAARGKFAEAREHFKKATELAPNRIGSYVLLGRLLRRQPHEVRARKETLDGVRGLADRTIDDMVQANQQSFRAYLARANYRREFGSGDVKQRAGAAEPDLREARRLAPDEAEVVLVSAELAAERGDLRQARDYLRAGCEKKNSADAQLYLRLAAVEAQDGKPDQAVTCLRQGLERVPGQAEQTELRWELANALVDAGQAEEASATARRLPKAHLRPGLLDYFNARLLMGEKKWLEAARLLEGAFPLLTADPRMAQQVGLLLARCYERLGDTDRAHAAYHRVLAVNAKSAAARLGSARVLAAMGQVPDALAQYRQLLRLSAAQSDVPAAVLTEMAGLLIALNLQAERADWAEVKELLAEAEKPAPSPEVAVLRAEMLVAQGDFDGARAALVRKADEKTPRPVEIWAALAALEDRQDHPEAALGLLDEAERRLGDGVELRLARAQHWAGCKEDRAGPALGRLVPGPDQFTADGRQRLLRGLAVAYARVGATAEAARLWADLAGQRPNDLSVRIAQFDLALTAGDGAAVERALAELRRIEGPEGTVWRYARAAHLIQAAKQGDGGALDEAEALLGPVAVRRPKWSRVPLCQGQIKELRKQPDAALARYLHALQLGDRSPLAAERAVALLYERHRYTEAYEVARQLPKQMRLSGELQKLVAELALQTGDDKGRALGLAQKAVAQGSTDYRDHLWLGRMLWLSGRPKEAEPAFRQALKLADNVPDTWVALIQYLAATKRKEEAQAAVEKAEGKLPTDKAALALAQCYEAVERRDRAEKWYAEALKARPDDVPTLQGVTGFCLRAGTKEGVEAAKGHLKKLMALRAKDQWAADGARRLLAVLLSAGGDYQQSREALVLLGLRENTPPEQAEVASVQELRARITVLALSPGRHERRQAIPILEKLIDGKAAMPEDQFLLAQLYEGQGDWGRASKAMLKLLSQPQGEAPRYLAHFALGLTRRGELDEAQAWLDKLEKRERGAGAPLPEDVRAKVTEAKARLLKARGQGREAAALLTAYAEEDRGRAAAVAALLEGLQEPEAAERLYRRYAEGGRDKRPESVLVLAQFLARRQRVPEALDLCEGAWRTCPPAAVAQACLFVVSQGSADVGQLARVERWLRAAEKGPQSAAVAAALAHVQNLQGRYDEAEATYRKAIAANARDPRARAMALNNLAFLLTLRGGDGPTALDLVQRACQAGGPRPGFLDTRAVVRLKMGDSRQAIKDLDDAVAVAPSASVFFHLAQARDQAHDQSGARRAWEQAKALGLKASNLHPLERTAYDQLARQMD